MPVHNWCQPLEQASLPHGTFDCQWPCTLGSDPVLAFCIILRCDHDAVLSHWQLDVSNVESGYASIHAKVDADTGETPLDSSGVPVIRVVAQTRQSPFHRSSRTDEQM